MRHPENPGRPEALDRAFAYDPLYRLRSATGRECDIPPATPWDPAPRCVDLTRTRGYTETYSYDPLGSLLELKHRGGGAGTTRTYAPAPDSNRLQAMTVSGDTTRYEHDANGNLTRESLSRLFRVGLRRPAARVSQPGRRGTSVVGHAIPLRRRRATREKARPRRRKGHGHGVRGRRFRALQDVRRRDTVENDTVHVIDGKSRIALVRLGPAFPGDATPTVQYHLGDHLGSSHVVLDASGSGVSHEEYTPYGETSFGSHALKRYRYSGKERDEESGLYYFGLRYYAPWLARWASHRPSGPRRRREPLRLRALQPNAAIRRRRSSERSNITDAGAPRSDPDEAKPPGAAAIPGGADTGPTGGAPSEYDPRAEKQYQGARRPRGRARPSSGERLQGRRRGGIVNHVVEDARKSSLGPVWSLCARQSLAAPVDKRSEPCRLDQDGRAG